MSCKNLWKTLVQLSSTIMGEQTRNKFDSCEGKHLQTSIGMREININLRTILIYFSNIFLVSAIPSSMLYCGCHCVTLYKWDRSDVIQSE